MKIARICFYLLLIVLLPFTTYAELTGHVVFIHPDNRDELWMTNIKDTRNARLLFKHNTVIRTLSVQKDSRVIAIVSSGKHFQKDEIYLVDTLRGHAVQIQNHINEGIDNIDISHNGDIIFTNTEGFQEIPKQGIYLIRRSERGKQNPKLILLKQIDVTESVDWAPNGKQIVHGSYKGLFMIDIETKNETRISKRGRYASFAPDGKKLAFSYFNVGTGNIQIDIISLDTLQPLRTIDDFVRHQYPSRVRWSPDGAYLTYRSGSRLLFPQETASGNIALPVNGGPAEIFLEMGDVDVYQFDWFNPAYPVEPKNHLTTLWGKIKR